MKKLVLVMLMMISILVTGCENGNNEGSTGNSGEVTTNTEENGDLRLYFFEMGKADAFIIYNNKTAILIDTGEKGEGKDILQYMENNKITKIDYLFITHFDQDHVGGANKVLGNTTVSQIYTSNYPKESEEYNTFMGRVKEKSIPTKVLRENLSLDVSGIKIDVNVPARELYEVDPSNNSSLIIRITYGEKTFLFMGDAMSDRIREYISTNPETCDVLKMPYHGKYMGCLDDMLAKLKPKYAVITSSKQDKEAQETMDLLEKYNVKKDDTLYRTRKGSVLMQTDGKEITVFQTS